MGKESRQIRTESWILATRRFLEGGNFFFLWRGGKKQVILTTWLREKPERNVDQKKKISTDGFDWSLLLSLSLSPTHRDEMWWRKKRSEKGEGKLPPEILAANSLKMNLVHFILWTRMGLVCPASESPAVCTAESLCVFFFIIIKHWATMKWVCHQLLTQIQIEWMFPLYFFLFFFLLNF